MGYEESGILNDTWSERNMYEDGVATTPLERSLFKLLVGADNLSVNSGQIADIDQRIKYLDPDDKDCRYTTLYVSGKVFTLSSTQLAQLITSLSALGYQAESVLKSIDDLIISAIDAGVDKDNGTIELVGSSGTTAAELLAAVAPMFGAVLESVKIYNAAKDTEKTDTDVLIATDVLISTARNGVDYWEYAISYAS